MDWTQVLAWYGAVLGTVGTALSVKHYLDRRRDRLSDVRVTMSEKVVFGVNRLTGEKAPPRDVLSVKAENHGVQRVTLKAFALVPVGHSSLFLILEPIGLQLPHGLEPGKDCSLVVEIGRLAHTAKEKGMEGVIQFRARFDDALGNAFLSAPVAFPVGRWLKEARG